MKLLCGSVLLILICNHHLASSLTSSQTSIIKTGTSRTSTLDRYIKTNNFYAVNYGGTYSRNIMDGITELVKAKKSRPSGSALTTLNSLASSFNSINAQFERTTSGFADVGKIIGWSSNYGTHEANIKVLSAKLREVVTASDSTLDSKITQFISNYEAKFNNANVKIWDGIIYETTFIKNVLNAVRQKSLEDRRKVQLFGIGLLQLLCLGVQVEVAYNQLKFMTDANTNYVKDNWRNKINEARNKINSADTAARNAFGSQQVKDYATFAQQNGGLSAQDFNTRLYYFMAGKYFWRRFFVFTKTYDKGFQLASSHCAGGYHQRGKSYVTYASIDNSVNIFTQDKAKALVDSSGVGNHNNAAAIRDVLRQRGGHCNNYAIVHVVCRNCGSGSNYWISYNSKRYERTFDARDRKKFTVWLFG